MNMLRYGYVTGPVIGALWTFVMAITACVIMSFSTGEAVAPSALSSLILGAWLGYVWLPDGDRSRSSRILTRAILAVLPIASFLLFRPAIFGPPETSLTTIAIGWVFLGISAAWPILLMLDGLPFGKATRHEFEEATIRFLTGFGYVFFTAIVIIPFYVMVMTSVKCLSAL